MTALPADDVDFYLLNITTKASTFATDQGSAKVLDLTVAPGTNATDTITDLASHAALDFTLTETEDGFYLSKGYSYLSATGTAVEKADAAVFYLDPVDGVIRVKEDGAYPCDNGSSGLVVEGIVDPAHTRLYLYEANTTLKDSQPVSSVNAEKSYVIAQVAGFTVNKLEGDVRVVVSTEEAGTPDVPAAGAKELINGANYFINDGTNYLAYVDGELTNDDSHSASDKTEMWIATEHKGTNGEPTTYSFVNRSTEKGKLAFKVEFKNNAFLAEATFDAEKGTYTQFFIDKDGKVSFTAKATNKAGQAVEQVYYLNFDGADWKFIADNSNVQNINFNRTDEGMALNANYLNKLAGNGSDFSFLFAANAKRDSLKPLNETVLSKMITAVDASKYNNAFSSYDADGSYSQYPISDGLLFSTSLSNDTKKTAIENFRASKFIIVNPKPYSAIIQDIANNRFFNYIEVSGSDLVDEDGILLAVPGNYNAENTDIKKNGVLAGVKYVFSNAIFKAQQYEGAQYSDPVYVTTPSAYCNPNMNEGGFAALSQITNLAVAVKNFSDTYYVGAAAARWENVYIGTNNDVTYK
ncbi:MAG: hypothetical protein LUD46_01710 [Parabacteroides sp.]|nr:hypothetical protein [Parabacteroides sp.]